MKRRNFVKTVGTAALLSPLANNQIIGKSTPPKEIIKPNRLKEGDTIGLVSPGSYVKEDYIKESIENLEKLGLKVHYTNRIFETYGYLAGSDKNRAEDLNEMFANDDIDGIVSVRGGYGCSRILPLLNYELIRSNPKPLIGYSDITALHYGIFAKTGLVCFHGPVGISTFNDFSIDYFKRTLMNTEPVEMIPAEENDDADNNEFDIYKITDGAAEGYLEGGNLSIIISMLGTPYDIDTKDKIIFIEEVGEEPYRIDRMLTHMMEAGKFDDAAGVALGVFKGCEPENEDPEFEHSFSLKEVLLDRLGNLGIPVIYGLSFGHIENKYTLPVGIKAKLDVSNQKLTLLEGAVK
jgi:muramoyltetrapeptide carboxypeptidase